MLNNYYVPFTKEMKKTHTILVPNMLPMHFKLIVRILRNYGYNAELLETSGTKIKETGLKYVHNDTCYPAILIIGQFISAIQSGKYDPHKVALVLFQTGGGCRASNYISLLRKALAKAGYEYVPVISFSLAGIEKHPGWKLTLPMLYRMVYTVLYGDILMNLKNQCRPYELEKGASEKLAKDWTVKLTAEMKTKAPNRKISLKYYQEIIDDFAKIKLDKSKEKVKVGIVGEIYVKYSPLGNNDLEDYLVSEGAQPVVPGLLDFLLYCLFNNLEDTKLYGRGRWKYPFIRLAFKFFQRCQMDQINVLKKDGRFSPGGAIKTTISYASGYIDLGTKMGEGWLLTTEMLELYHQGIKNIICTQPFGCLPNHICGKGMMKPIKENNPDINIVAIDYDASSPAVNQQNRIKLMLANAQK